MSLYRLLIVDDENQIRDGLRRIITWEDYNIDLCGEASEGTEALVLVEKMHPHIILTDVKMPGMDGITLLSEVRRRWPEIKIIVLSGYDDFTLVRQAMKLGAVDYLLKPAGKNELVQLVEELIDQMTNVQFFKMNRVDSIDLAKNNFLNRIITNSVSAMEFHEKMELLEMDFGSEPMVVARLEFIENLMDSQEMFYRMSEILSVCQNFLTRNKKGIAFTNTAGGIVCLLTGMLEIDIRMECEKLLNDLLTIIKEKIQKEMFFAVSKTVKSYRGLGVAYQEAEDTLKYKFIFDEITVLFKNEIEEYFEKSETISMVKQSQIEDLVKVSDEIKMRKYLDEMFGNSRDKWVNADYYVMRNMAMEMVVYLFHFLMTKLMIDRRKVNREKDNALKNLVRITTLNSMKLFLIEVYGNICIQYNQIEKIHYSKIVCDTIQYIKEKYDNMNLSLQYLADEFGVNTAYLGRTFKKETGNNFIDYLNLYRIEEARILLQETNIKGSEIYKKVGFSNYNYFYIVFKKITGQSPTEARCSNIRSCDGTNYISEHNRS